MDDGNHVYIRVDLITIANCNSSPSATGYTIASGASSYGSSRSTTCASWLSGTGASISCTGDSLGNTPRWSAPSGCTRTYGQDIQLFTRSALGRGLNVAVFDNTQLYSYAVYDTCKYRRFGQFSEFSQHTTERQVRVNCLPRRMQLCLDFIINYCYGSHRWSAFSCQQP